MRTRELNEKELESIRRVFQLIDEECGGKAQVFADKTGVAKASISHYKHHIHTPNQDHAYLIGKAFSVNPMWVMGFDAPKEMDWKPEKAAEDFFSGIMKDRDLMDALKVYTEMPPEKKKRVVEIIRLLGAE